MKNKFKIPNKSTKRKKIRLSGEKCLYVTFYDFPSQSPSQSLHLNGCSEDQLPMNKSSIPLDRACIDGQLPALIARIDK